MVIYLTETGSIGLQDTVSVAPNFILIMGFVTDDS